MGPMKANDSRITLPQFTGLRGLAALLVLFFHVRSLQGTELHFGLADAFSKFGVLGVDMFFVLSGFILSHVYGKMFADGYDGKALRAYGVARFSRIYPLHFVTLFMMLGAYAVALRVGVDPTVTSGYSLRNLVLSLFLVNEWFGVVAPNPGSWSISVEFASYLIFPILTFRLLRLPSYMPTLVLVVGVIIIESFSGRVLRGFTEFAMGCAAYVAARHYDARPLSIFAGITFAIPFVAAAIAGHELASLSAVSFAATVFLLSGSPSPDPFRYLCSTRVLVFLGEISYSVYLLQWFIWIGWKHVIANTPFFSVHPHVMVLGAAGSIIFCATASFYFFEKPMRVWLRRLNCVQLPREATVTVGQNRITERN